MKVLRYLDATEDEDKERYNKEIAERMYVDASMSPGDEHYETNDVACWFNVKGDEIVEFSGNNSKPADYYVFTTDLLNAFQMKLKIDAGEVETPDS